MGHIPNLVLPTLKAGFPNLWNSVDSVFRQHFVILTTLVFQKLKFLFPWVQNYELKIILSYSKHKPMHYYWLKTICQTPVHFKTSELEKNTLYFRTSLWNICTGLPYVSPRVSIDWKQWFSICMQHTPFPLFQSKKFTPMKWPYWNYKVWISLWLVRFVIIPLNERKKSSFETANISLSIKGRGW